MASGYQRLRHTVRPALGPERPQLRIAAIYGITTIPANLLVNPQGKIIAADLRGKALTRKLEELFNEL